MRVLAQYAGEGDIGTKILRLEMDTDNSCPEHCATCRQRGMLKRSKGSREHDVHKVVNAIKNSLSMEKLLN